MNNLNSLSNNNSSNGGKKGSLIPKGKYSNLVGIIIGIIALIIISFLLHKMVQTYQSNKISHKTVVVLQKYMFDCMNNHKIIPNDSMSASAIGNQYNLTFWFYINDLEFNYYSNKNIMVKGDIIKHLEDDTKPPTKVNPRIYIPKQSNSLIFEFEVDHGLDKLEGCYPLKDNKILFTEAPADAPAEVDMDCYQTHSDSDYYALTAPLQGEYGQQDKTIRGLCTGLTSSQLDVIDKTEDNNNCLPNLEKLLKKSENYTFTDYEKASQTLITALTTAAATEAEAAKATIYTLIADIKNVYDNESSSPTSTLVDLEKKIKLITPTITLETVRTASDSAKKLHESLNQLQQKLQSLISNKYKFTDKLEVYQKELKNLILKVRGIYGTLQSNENNMMKNNDKYGNADHMYVKRANVNHEQKTEIKNVPIQRWNHVSINVNNNIADIFFNGDLELSTVHNGSIKPNTNSLIVGAIDSKGESGFNGFVSDIVYSNYVLSEADILGAGSVYKRGPSIMKTTIDSIKSLF